jgi:hypothetical protein
MTAPHKTLAILAICSTLLAPITAAWANEAKDIAWLRRVDQRDLTLSLNPLGPDQRLAFYMARGFTAEQIAPYAAACGFSVGLLNSSRQVLRTELRHWRALDNNGQRIPLRLPESWDAQWARSQVAAPQRIAFRWAQFQSENIFEPGDWIMGMITLATPIAGPFRLVAKVQLGENTQEMTIDDLHCDTPQ